MKAEDEGKAEVESEGMLLSPSAISNKSYS